MTYDTGFLLRCDCGKQDDVHVIRRWGKCKKCQEKEGETMSEDQSKYKVDEEAEDRIESRRLSGERNPKASSLAGLDGVVNLVRNCGKVTLSCRRCGNAERDQPKPGLCEWCAAVVIPDPIREAEIDRRIYDMKRIHELECEMTDMERREWISHGQYIIDRRLGVNRLNGIMGDK